MAQSFDAAVEPQSSRSAVAWQAIIAGAFAAAGATLILLALGSGLGFASISPWSDHGVSATTFTITAAIWLLVTQWLSAGLGGYLAGRLRTRWVGTHVHEVFFRDTAHGLVTWAVATALVAAGCRFVRRFGDTGAEHMLYRTPRRPVLMAWHLAPSPATPMPTIWTSCSGHRPPRRTTRAARTRAWKRRILPRTPLPRAPSRTATASLWSIP